LVKIRFDVGGHVERGPPQRPALLLAIIIAFVSTLSEARDLTAQAPGYRPLTRARRQAADCDSSACADCRGSCDGCNNCPLCALTQKACDSGKKLKLGGVDICDRCKYCRGGKDECKRKCLLGKKEAVCQKCINQCPKK